MNWRRLLFLYTAKVADECGAHPLAADLRHWAAIAPVMDGGDGIRILTNQNGSCEVSRSLGNLPREVNAQGDFADLAFVTPIETVADVRPYYRTVTPKWAKE